MKCEKNQFNCPVEATLSLIGGKYKPLILWHLIDHPLHYMELQRLISNATPKMLSQQLHDLENNGILHIRIVQGCAFSVEADGLYDVLAVGQDVVCDSPGKQRVTLEYGQAVPYALTDTAFLGSFQSRFDFLNALGWLHGVHGVF